MIWDPYPVDQASSSFDTMPVDLARPIILDHLYPPPPHRSSIETRLRAHRHSIISPH